jgi:hypothetical protein
LTRLSSHGPKVLERDLIVDVLRQTANNRLQAAKRLGISRVTLYKKLRKYGLFESRNGDHGADPDGPPSGIERGLFASPDRGFDAALNPPDASALRWGLSM